MTPEVAAKRLLWSLGLGAAMGFLYGALGPLGRKRRHLADGLFVLGFWWEWLYLSFAVCQGDIRSGCFWAMLAGMGLWQLTAGRLLEPVFARVWKFLERTWGFFLYPGKKFLKNTKILFASAEKWVTIKCTVYGIWKKNRERRYIPWKKQKIRP